MLYLLITRTCTFMLCIKSLGSLTDSWQACILEAIWEHKNSQLVKFVNNISYDFRITGNIFTFSSQSVPRGVLQYVKICFPISQDLKHFLPRFQDFDSAVFQTRHRFQINNFLFSELFEACSSANYYAYCFL